MNKTFLLVSKSLFTLKPLIKGKKTALCSRCQPLWSGKWRVFHSKVCCFPVESDAETIARPKVD